MNQVNLDEKHHATSQDLKEIIKTRNAIVTIINNTIKPLTKEQRKILAMLYIEIVLALAQIQKDNAVILN